MANGGRVFSDEVRAAARRPLRRLWFYEGMETGDTFTVTTEKGDYRFQYARDTRGGIEVTGYGPLGPGPMFRTFRADVVAIPSTDELALQRAEREAQRDAETARTRAKKERAA